jgi:hypothetical protein
LQKDLAIRQERAVQAAAFAAQQRRQRRDNAKSLLDELLRRGTEDRGELLEALRSVARGDQSGNDAEAILAKGFGLLAPRDISASLTVAQRKLAEALTPDSPATSYDTWKQAHAQGHDRRLRHVDETLVELGLLLETAAVEQLNHRLRAIEASSNQPGFDMRLDSFVVDLAAAVRTAKAEAVFLATANELSSELAVDGGGEILSGVRDALAAAISARAMTNLPTLIAAGREALTKQVAAQAAHARRAAVLAGLSALGYEVKEGMSAAWADKGRVVLRNPALPGYGVEVAGPAEANRLQVRPVALSANHDTRRDRDIETIWCGDFGKLQALIASRGGGVAIERALEIGATPLKTVVWASETNNGELVSKPMQTQRPK